MIVTAYDKLSELAILSLCVWREAQGEGEPGRRGVAHVIANRVRKPWWYNSPKGNKWIVEVDPATMSLWHRTVLKPYQFSSFNHSDPNEKKWPSDTDPSWEQCMSVASGVYLGMDDDLTAGALYYYDTSIMWPGAWGDPSNYENTLNVGRLKFYRPVLHSNEATAPATSTTETQ